MKRLIEISGIVIIVWGLISCDIIKEDDRFIEVEKTNNGDSIVKKTVLLLDFTDQTCINCPDAAELIEGYKGTFDSAFIAVSIHAYSGTNPFVTLHKTDDGDKYEEQFNKKSYVHPKGSIDGAEAVTTDNWAAAIVSRLNVTPPIKIELNCNYNSENGTIFVNSTLKGYEKTSNLKLLLWIIESKIIARQMMPNKQWKMDYEHNHVFRASINGTWGEDITVEEGGILEKENSFILDLSKKWAPENISIVGFVFNSNTYEVYQTDEIHLLNNIEKHN
jgi:hypothetical protein